MGSGASTPAPEDKIAKAEIPDEVDYETGMKIVHDLHELTNEEEKQAVKEVIDSKWTKEGDEYAKLSKADFTKAYNDHYAPEDAAVAAEADTNTDATASATGSGPGAPETSTSPVEGEAAPAENAVVEVADATPAASEETIQMKTIHLTALPDSIDAAIENGKWPLILDSTPNSPAITFLTYQSYVMCVEAKKAIRDVSIAKTKTVEQQREEWREALVSCMVNRKRTDNASPPGKTFWLHLDSAAIDFIGTYCTGDDGTLPLVMFNQTEMAKDDVKRRFLSPSECEEMDEGKMCWGVDFKMILTSKFESEDYVDFLKDFLPLDQLQVLNINVEDK